MPLHSMLPPSDKTWMPHSITTNPFFKTVIFFCFSLFFRASLPELVLLYLPTHCTLDGRSGTFVNSGQVNG